MTAPGNKPEPDPSAGPSSRPQWTWHDPDAVAAALRKGAPHDSPNGTAAAELLISHRYWLGRTDFIRACTSRGTPRYILWESARDFAGAGQRDSPSQLAVLRAAIAIATDDLGLRRLDRVDRQAVADAFAQALGTAGDGGAR